MCRVATKRRKIPFSKKNGLQAIFLVTREKAMQIDSKELAATVAAVRLVLPSKDFEVSKRFYRDLGFDLRQLTDSLLEMRLGEIRFLLQNYYVKEWADNFVIHVLVSNAAVWWEHIVSLDLAVQYGVKTMSPRQEDWGLVAGLTDPSGVLWRIVEE
jgi:hypothetical protein